MRFLTPRRAVIAAAVVVVATMAAALWVDSAARSRWDAATRSLRAAEHEWRNRDFRRPALSGDSTPGRAFDSYEEALSLAASLRGDHDHLRKLWLRPESVPPAEAAALQARWAPAVAAVRLGAHRGDARRELTLFENRAGTASLLDCRWLTNLLIVAARESLDANDPEAAVVSALDAATFGADLTRSPLVVEQMIGLALIGTATDQFWSADRLSRLPAAALDLLALGLQRLDAWLAVPASLDGEFLFTGHLLERSIAAGGAVRLGDATFELTDTWRFGLSPRWMAADAILTLDAALSERRAIAWRPWPSRHRALESLQSDLDASPNPIVRVAGWPVLMIAEANARQQLAKLRLLRMTIDTLRGVPPARLEDPLGDG